MAVMTVSCIRCISYSLFTVRCHHVKQPLIHSIDSGSEVSHHIHFPFHVRHDRPRAASSCGWVEVGPSGPWFSRTPIFRDMFAMVAESPRRAVSPVLPPPHTHRDSARDEIKITGDDDTFANQTP